MKTSIGNMTILVIATLCFALFSAACATVRGVGRDVGTAGRGIERSTH